MVDGAVARAVDVAAMAASDRDHDDQPFTARTARDVVRHVVD
jgi:hypothetical protein